MNSKPLKVAVLYGMGSPNPEYREFLAGINNLKLLPEARDPVALLNRPRENQPDLLLVDLNGTGAIPPWLDSMATELPRTEVMVCSHSRDPDFLINIMKLRIGGFLPLPLNREEFLAAMERIQADKEQHRTSRQNQILGVIGTKGGVGTTSIAANLAVALAEIAPEEVILVDLARPFPQVGQFLDLKCQHTIMDLAESADKLDQMFLKKIVQRHDGKLEVLLNSPNHQLSSMVPDQEVMSQIFAGLRTHYQWVVVDLGLWPDQFYARVLREADQVLVVTELTIPDLQNMKIIKSLFLDWDLDEGKVKVIVNRYTKNYALGIKDLENISHWPVFQTLADEPETLKEAINQGEPLGKLAPRSKLWRQLKGIAAELVAQNKTSDATANAPRSGLLRRLFL